MTKSDESIKKQSSQLRNSKISWLQMIPLSDLLFPESFKCIWGNEWKNKGQLNVDFFHEMKYIITHIYSASQTQIFTESCLFTMNHLSLIKKYQKMICKQRKVKIKW